MNLADTEFDWFITLLPVGMGASLLVYVLFFSPAPEAPPANSTIFGCYATDSAPPIRIDENGMQILQEGFPLIGFHLERHKQGIVLTAEAPINARPNNGKYVYGISERGIGLFLRFYKVLNGKVYAVFEQAELSGFRMLARDGGYLPYDPVEAAICEAPPYSRASF
ncbi:MAG: hypothetical protein GW855_00950 [Erythrobacter sp.]|nr:hypothetical protein [Erythrobacter sp.]NCQ65038.1 hypothetical protein [Alphaproteobacteria bacterium]